jgi:hypothetical protein
MLSDSLVSSRFVVMCVCCCRALAGEDGIDSLTSRAGSYAKRVAWVNANREAIVAAVKERMLQLATSAA